jgi:hypothetical protein
MLLADVASAGIPRDGDIRPAYGLFSWTPRGWRVQIRRVRYPVRRETQALTARRVPGGSLLVHKLLEARYRHHAALIEAARRHSGLPPVGGRPAIEPLRPVDGGAHPVPAPVVLTPPEGIPAQVERPVEAVVPVMAAVAPLGREGVDSVDESDAGLADETAVTFR